MITFVMHLAAVLSAAELFFFFLKPDNYKSHIIIKPFFFFAFFFWLKINAQNKWNLETIPVFFYFHIPYSPSETTTKLQRLLIFPTHHHPPLSRPHNCMNHIISTNCDHYLRKEKLPLILNLRPFSTLFFLLFATGGGIFTGTHTFTMTTGFSSYFFFKKIFGFVV